MKCFAFLVIFLFGLGLVNASGNYFKEIDQVGNKLVVRENISGNYSSYVLSSGLEKTSEGYIFLDKLNFNQSYDSVQIKLNLEKGLLINNYEAYPTGYLLETDGQTISLVWNLERVSSGSDFAIFVNLEDTNKSSLLRNIFIGLVMVLFVFIGFLFYKKYFKSKRLNKKIEKYLLDSEKKVLNELEKAEGKELWQKQIQLKTNFSKAKLSRVIRNLESRNLIEKIPLGNTNKIKLR
jgi:uncharacterized membrane protein